MSASAPTIDRRLAAQRTEEGLTPELTDHVGRVGAFERREAERDIGERLGEHTSDAHHDAATELRIGVQPGDELAGTGCHVGDEQVDRTVVGRGEGEERDRGVAHRGGVGESESHEAAFGLVRDPGPVAASPPPGTRPARRQRPHRPRSPRAETR